MAELKQIASNTLVQLVGRVIGTAFGIVTIAIITRALGVDGYGQFTLALTFLAVAGALADFGFTLTTTQLLSEEGTNDNTVISTAFTMRLLSGVVFFSLATLAGLLTDYDPVVKAAIAVGAFSFFFMTSGQMLVGVFQKNLTMWRPAVAEAVSRGLILVLVIVLAANSVSAAHIMAAFAIGNALMLLINLWYTRPFVRLRLSIDRKLARTFLVRSWPIAISIFFNLLYLKGDILFLSVWRSDAEIGLYGAAYKVLDVISVIPTMFMGLLLPMMVAAWSKKDLPKMRTLLQQALDFFALLSLPMLGGTLVLAPAIMRLIAGDEFAGAGIYLMILMLANTIVFFGILSGHAIVGINRQRAILPAYIVTAIVAIVLYLVTIPTHGALGAAWTTVISELLIATLTMTVVARHTKFRPTLRGIGIYLVATVAMTASVYWLKGLLNPLSHIDLVALVVFGAIVYGSIVLLFGGIKKETVRLLLKRT